MPKGGRYTKGSIPSSGAMHNSVQIIHKPIYILFMHNLHFVKLRAASGEDAVKEVEEDLVHFGDDNNWYSVCGAVSENGDVYTTNDGRYNALSVPSFSDISKCVNNWMRMGINQDVQERLRDNTDITTWNSTDVYLLKKHANHIHELMWQNLINTEFDAHNGKHELYPGNYTECGLTYAQHLNSSEEDALWIVFVDMHS